MRAAIAVKSKNSTNERQEDDFYATDPKAIEALCNYTRTHINKIAQTYLKSCNRDNFGYAHYIWECAAGNGNLAYWLKDHGYNVVASDLKYREGHRNDGLILHGLDFLTTYPYNKFKGAAAHPLVILTNPPYSLATEFIEHALDILPDGGLYIALMNITYLAGQKRYQRVYSKGSLREIYVFSKRIECWKNGERPKDKCGSIANYAWYVFQKGYKGQPTLYWL